AISQTGNFELDMVSLPINFDSLRFSSFFLVWKGRVSPRKFASGCRCQGKVRYPGGPSGAPLCFTNGALQQSPHTPCMRGSRDPALGNRAGFSFARPGSSNRASSARNTIETFFAFHETIFRLPHLNPYSQRVTNRR